jgi:hypothetical protein
MLGAAVGGFGGPSSAIVVSIARAGAVRVMYQVVCQGVRNRA